MRRRNPNYSGLTSQHQVRHKVGKLMEQRKGLTRMDLFVISSVVVEVIAVGLVVAFVVKYYRDRQISGFTPVQAVVYEVFTSKTQGRGSHYEWAIGYRYVIDGQEYKASQIGNSLTGYTVWNGHTNTSDEAREEALRFYPKGAKYTAYYNPAEPGDAVLERDSPSLTGLLIPAVLALVGLPGSVPALISVWQWLRSRRREHRAIAPSALGDLPPEGQPKDG